jgi:SAM-dependent methyltransferase
MAVMATEVDPAHVMPYAILQAADLHDARILEVGAGDGRLTFQYASQARRVIGIDTTELDIRSAVATPRKEIPGQVQFLCASATALPFSDEQFEIVLLASSLWWVEQEGMVHALREAWRVLARRGVLIDVRPAVAPLVVEVITAAQQIWAKEVASFSAPEDVAAADAAVQYAISHEWFAFERSNAFDFEILCDSAAELSVYAKARKLRGEDIPYDELEERRRELGADGQAHRLRCRRPWSWALITRSRSFGRSQKRIRRMIDW